MTYPIIEVKTEDGLTLFGFLTNTNKSDVLYLNIHGTGSNFFCEGFERVFHEELPKLGVDVLFTNNRGSYALDSWQDTGASVEIFEDSVLDINSWISWALQNNYKRIILAGHSFGTEKVVYYMSNGAYRTNIAALIIMGFCDTVGTQQLFERSIHVNLVEEAKDKVAKGVGYELLSSHRRAQAGELPISASTYLNFFSEDSELSKVTPFRNFSTLPMIESIKVPILAIIGDHDEYTVIPIPKAMDLLKKENPLLEAQQIPGSGHCYDGYENQLIDLVKEFISGKVQIH